ncbi:MAG: hypothetical protein IKK21_05480 [Clostridia bacterium]|nr:hypothetical protein [Clostridia bacterium]
MVNWMYFPRNMILDEISREIVGAFKKVESAIDSYTQNLVSNDVLKCVEPHLLSLGFSVEQGKRAEEKIHIPVLFGINGEAKLAFEADAYNQGKQYVIEVEAGRAVVNHQFLKDFFEACAMHSVEYLCIAVRNEYKKRKDFLQVCSFFDSLYMSGRMGIPLKGLLIIGY